MRKKWRIVLRRGIGAISALWLISLLFVIVATEKDFYWPPGTPRWVSNAYNSLQDVYAITRDSAISGILKMRLAGMPREPGKDILILDPLHPRWHGRSAEAEQILQELIAIAREEKLMQEDILPIRLGVAPFRSMGGVAPLTKSTAVIIVSARILAFQHDPFRKLAKYILAHEFAHTLSRGDGHGATWQRICDVLYNRFLGPTAGHCFYKW